jgi:KDO2-lipid IV(A) lauroyltransferase
MSFFISKLSLRTLDRLARFLTFVLFRVFRLRRSLILKNLDIAFANEKTAEEKEEIASSCFYHFVLTSLEFLYFRKGDIAKNMSYVGAESLVRALEKGKGAYVIAMHMSNWEASASGVSKQIKPVHVVVKKVGSEGVNRFVTELRTANGMNVILRKSTGDAVRSMRNVLKKGDVVAVMLDQARPGEPFLPFFGRPAKTNTSFTAIWARIKAPVFMAYSVRLEPGKYVTYVLEEVPLQDTGDSKIDVEANSTHINQLIESCIRKCPEQYFWLHNRWKA